MTDSELRVICLRKTGMEPQCTSTCPIGCEGGQSQLDLGSALRAIEELPNITLTRGIMVEGTPPQLQEPLYAQRLSTVEVNCPGGNSVKLYQKHRRHFY